MSILPDLDRRSRFESVLRQVAGPVRAYLVRRTDPDTAEDVLSETLLVCWRRLDDIPADPLPWTYVVARNCLANAERAARRRGRLVQRLRSVADATDVPGPGEEPYDAPVTLALARLRPADAEILRLWAWEGLGPSGLAAALEVSENAATIRLHRAKRRLRTELGKDAATGGHIRGERRADG